MISDVEFGVIRGANLAIRDITEEAQDIIDRKHEALVKALIEIDQLKGELIRERMSNAGQRAQLLAFKTEHLNSPLFHPTGEMLEDGRPQSLIHRVFDEAFDEKGRDLGVENPANLRQQSVEEVLLKQELSATREAENDCFLATLAPPQKKKRFFGLGR